MTQWYVMIPASPTTPVVYINPDGTVEEDVECVDTFTNKADAETVAEEFSGSVHEAAEVRPEDLDQRLVGETWDEEYEDPFEGMTDAQIEQSVHYDPERIEY